MPIKRIKYLVRKSRWKLAVKTLPFLVLIILAKMLISRLGYEYLTLNSLFTALISANIFLIGFLISGVLADYKESEKLPGDLAASMEALADEGYIIYQNKKSPVAREYLTHLLEFNQLVLEWFYKREKTARLNQKLFEFNRFFLAFEPLTQANFIVRLKQEQQNIRKMLHRIHAIRETSFLGTGYAIAEIISALLTLGMIFIRIDPFYESVFFVFFVTFILIYMIYFIKDLDNPFGYSQSTENNLVEEVSLKPVFDSQERIADFLKQCEK
jgi:hypothetical protein